jgi:hypothetical protein
LPANQPGSAQQLSENENLCADIKMLSPSVEVEADSSINRAIGPSSLDQTSRLQKRL